MRPAADRYSDVTKLLVSALRHLAVPSTVLETPEYVLLDSFRGSSSSWCRSVTPVACNLWAHGHRFRLVLTAGLFQTSPVNCWLSYLQEPDKNSNGVSSKCCPPSPHPEARAGTEPRLLSP